MSSARVMSDFPAAPKSGQWWDILSSYLTSPSLTRLAIARAVMLLLLLNMLSKLSPGKVRAVICHHALITTKFPLPPVKLSLLVQRSTTISPST